MWFLKQSPSLHTRNTSIHMEYTMYSYHRTLPQWEDELINDKATDGVDDLLTFLQQN